MVHAKMGTTHSSSFTCSTSAGVHRRHGLSFVPADDPPVLSGAFTQKCWPASFRESSLGGLAERRRLRSVRLRSGKYGRGRPAAAATHATCR